jgi:ATP-dependent Lon protease
MTGTKVKQIFPDIAIMKNADRDSIFKSHNLPSFVKDYIISKHINSDGSLDKQAITEFLGKHISDNNYPPGSRLRNGESVQLLTRFIVSSDFKDGKVRFAIPDADIREGIIPENLLSRYKKELIDGETWGVIKLEYILPCGKDKGYIKMSDFRPFQPYHSLDLKYFIKCRKQFTTEEWLDVLLSAMEYSPTGFADTKQKLEFLTRLLPFVEPRLNMIELGPKSTGKSYVFDHISKYGWLISGGKVSRAKLFYNKATKQPGIMSNYDVVAFDEVQNIDFHDADIQPVLKHYLEDGTAKVDNYDFRSDCGMVLLGNIPLTAEQQPRNDLYVNALPANFQETALLERFHGFIEGWKLPRLTDKNIKLNDWTLNVEYFSEILHLLRSVNGYSLLIDQVLEWEETADVRDLKAVKRMTTAYWKLLFPHITKAEELDKDEFRQYCLEPAIHRRGIIRGQCHKIDAEFKVDMPEIRMRSIMS